MRVWRHKGLLTSNCDMYCIEKIRFVYWRGSSVCILLEIFCALKLNFLNFSCAVSVYLVFFCLENNVDCKQIAFLEVRARNLFLTFGFPSILFFLIFHSSVHTNLRVHMLSHIFFSQPFNCQSPYSHIKYLEAS